MEQDTTRTTPPDTASALATEPLLDGSAEKSSPTPTSSSHRHRRRVVVRKAPAAAGSSAAPTAGRSYSQGLPPPVSRLAEAKDANRNGASSGGNVNGSRPRLPVPPPSLPVAPVKPAAAPAAPVPAPPSRNPAGGSVGSVARAVPATSRAASGPDLNRLTLPRALRPSQEPEKETVAEVVAEPEATTEATEVISSVFTDETPVSSVPERVAPAAFGKNLKDIFEEFEEEEDEPVIQSAFLALPEPVHVPETIRTSEVEEEESTETLPVSSSSYAPTLRLVTTESASDSDAPIGTLRSGTKREAFAQSSPEGAALRAARVAAAKHAATAELPVPVASVRSAIEDEEPSLAAMVASDSAQVSRELNYALAGLNAQQKAHSRGRRLLPGLIGTCGIVLCTGIVFVIAKRHGTLPESPAIRAEMARQQTLGAAGRILKDAGVLGTQERYDEASDKLRDGIKLLDKAKADAPIRAEARGQLGIALTALHKYSEAEKVINAGIKLDPKSAALHNNLAVAIYSGATGRAGKLRALAELKKAVELEPETASLHQNLAMILNSLGETGAAEHESQMASGLKQTASASDPNFNHF